MKRTSAIFTALALLLTMGGCGKTENTESSAAAQVVYADTASQLEISEEVTATLQGASTFDDSIELTILYTNLTDKELCYGAEPLLEKEIDGAWYEVPIRDDAAWITLGYLVPANGTSEYTTSLQDVYENLEYGHYRYLKKIGTAYAAVTFDYVAPSTGTESVAAAVDGADTAITAWIDGGTVFTGMPTFEVSYENHTGATVCYGVQPFLYREEAGEWTLVSYKEEACWEEIAFELADGATSTVSVSLADYYDALAAGTYSYRKAFATEQVAVTFEITDNGSVQVLDDTVGTLCYRITSDGSLQLTSVDTSVAALAIPATYEGTPITAICAGTFDTAANVSAIRIPYTVCELDTALFAGCETKPVIYGYCNSAAQTFAAENALSFSMLGDMNGDETVSADDAALILMQYARMLAFDDAADAAIWGNTQLYQGDLNGDEQMDCNDAVAALKYDSAVAVGKENWAEIMK